MFTLLATLIPSAVRASAAQSVAARPATADSSVPLYDGLGGVWRKVSTISAEARWVRAKQGCPCERRHSDLQEQRDERKKVARKQPLDDAYVREKFELCPGVRGQHCAVGRPGRFG